MIEPFNRSFANLNSERQYCFAGFNENVPSDLIADLKIRVPNQLPLYLDAFYVSETAIRLIFICGNAVVLSYTSDVKNSVDVNNFYTLTSKEEGYSGVIQFGSGIKREYNLDIPLRISEECLSRYRPSILPYAAKTCSSVRLSGEVSFTTNDDVTTVKHAGPAFPGKEGVEIRLPERVFINYSNGLYAVNADAATYIYTLAGVEGDDNQNVQIVFGPHFVLHGVVDDVDTSNGNVVNKIAVETDLSATDICGAVESLEITADTIHPCVTIFETAAPELCEGVERDDVIDVVSG